MISIYTLGRLLLKQDDTQLTGFVSQKAVALFVYLVAHPGIHQRDMLAGLFWSDTSDKQALKNLRTVLSSLQKQLGDYMDVTRQTLEVVNRDALWFDVQVFDTRLDAVKERMAHPYSPRRQMQDLVAAVNLYRGEFLVGLKADNAPNLDTWITLERERLHTRVVQALLQLTRITLENGYYAQGVDYARRLLTLDPWLEDAQRAMMQLLVFQGNRNAAIQQYLSFERLLQTELGVPPEAETTELFQTIKAGRLQVVPHVRPNNLQVEKSEFVEDTPLVQRVMQQLDEPECRLITLLGPGGTGKTSLASHIAHQRLEDYQHGVFFVMLASLPSAGFVPQAILNAIGVPRPDTRRAALDVLLEQLHSQHLLLILDNFEHLPDATEMVQQILDNSRYVQILVTSREQLHLQQERIIVMNGLAVETTGDSIAPALRLFEVAARRQQPAFSLDDHLPAVQRICELVDGLPLAIVIAAGWLNMLQPEAIAEQIASSLDFLTSSHRDLPERHRGIRLLLDATWDTLTPPQQQTLMYLSVFPADFSLEAALHVGQTNMVILRELVSRSLLQFDDEYRYSLHELLRRYAGNRADQADLLTEARYAHYDHYRRKADDIYESSLPVHRQIAEIERDYHNFWYFDWLPADEQRAYILHLARVLCDYWVARGEFIKEGIALIEQGLLGDPGDSMRAHGLVILSKLRFHDGLYDDETVTILQNALTLAEKLDDISLTGMVLNDLERVLAARGEFEQARVLLHRMIALYESASAEDTAHWRLKQIISRAYTNLGVTSLQLGDFEVARTYTQQGLEVNIDEEDDFGIAIGHNTLGIIALEQQDYVAAHTHFTRALTLVQTMRHTRLETIFSGNLAESLHKQENFAGACDMYCTTLAAAHRIDNRKTMVNVLEQLVDIALDLDCPREAALFQGASLQMRESINLAVQPREIPHQEARAARLEALHEEANLQRILTEGRVMPVEELIQLANTLQDTDFVQKSHKKP